MIFIGCTSSSKQKSESISQDNMSDYFATEDEGVSIPERNDGESESTGVASEPDAEKNMEDYFATEDEMLESSNIEPIAAEEMQENDMPSVADEQEDSESLDEDAIENDESSMVESTPAKIKSAFTIPVMPTEYQKDPQGLQVLDANGQPMIVFKAYDADKIKQALYTLEQFGPNPYLQNPPAIDDEGRKRFSEAMLAIKALPIIKVDNKNENKKKLVLSDAEKNLQKLIDDLPSLSGSAYNMAVLKYQQNDFKKALGYCEIALQRNLYNQDARNLQASIYRETSDFEKSEALHKENMKVWAGYKPAYRNLGILYDLYMGKSEEALPYYQQYNVLLVEEDRQVLGWILDIQRRLQAQRDAINEKQIALAAAAREQEVDVSESDVTEATDVESDVVSEEEMDVEVESTAEEGSSNE